MADRTCALPQCSRPVEARDWCNMHYHRWRRYGDPTVKRSRTEISRSWVLKRFRWILEMSPTDECIELGPQHPPVSKLFERYRPATHVVWRLMHGVDPSPLWVLHHCDNRLCLNPRHLYLGTARDNANDREDRRRHPGTKLSAANVRAIRRRWPSESQAALAREFGVVPATVNLIVHGKNWQWVKSLPPS
jgi:hypothetical protein